MTEHLATSDDKPSMPVTPKGKRTYLTILSAARKIFAEHGYVAMRMSDVADQAEISMGALYRYFKNKEDLFVSLISDIHQDLLDASRVSKNDFKTDPYNALLEANFGYLEKYYENRDIMRALMEAVTVEKHERDIWWQMRVHHIERFVNALNKHHNISEINGISANIISEALASMVEQSAYCWYAHENLNSTTVPLDVAAKILTDIWYREFFASTNNS